MQKKNLTRVVAMLLCLTMLLGMLPIVAMADEDGLVLHYDFESLTTGTIVEDVSGNGMAGEVMPRGSGVLTEEVEIYGQKKTAIVIAGGTPEEGHNYVELPAGVLNDLESVTVSCWVYVNKTVSYGRIWDFGSNTTSYMYLLDAGANDGHKGYTSAITGSGWSNEIGPEKGSNLATKTWKLTTVTFDGPTKTMALYEDGELIGKSTAAVDLSKLQGTTQNWIGYGQFKDNMFNGMVADFRIYDYAMSEGEVAQLFEIPDENRVDRDYNSLKLSGTDALEQNLKLPSVGSAGSNISWKSSNPAVITDAGVITRPAAGQVNGTATLTATIYYGEASREKSFDITVLALPTNQKRVEDDAAKLNLGNLNAVTANLSLPAKGAQDTTVTWSSADHTYLSDEGKVTRPVGDPVTVKLTATVSYDDAVTTREFDVTIMPRYEKLDAVKAETVNVTTKVGIAPSLPAVVMTTFENGTTGMVKVTWPTSLNASDYAQPGTKVVTGQLVDHNVSVTANVTVVSELETPNAIAELMQLSDVTLDGDDTIYSQNMGRALQYLKVMDADRMLYNFRKTFGQDTKGARALSGWDEPSGLLRGHSTGHFMSALAEAYASTGDEAYKEKLDYMIDEMRKLQLLSKGKASEFVTACTSSSAAQSKWSTDPSTWGEGFISAYSPDQFALLEQYTPYATIWAPYYTLHKLMAGFLDSYVYAGNETGLEIATDLGLWVYDRLSACTAAQRTKMWSMYIAGEYGGMNEVLARLYEITGEERLLAASQMFDNTEFFNGLAANKDTIQTRHANQHIPQIVGAIHEYAATGDPFYYNVAQHFWEMATARYAYSIGGVGTGESFKQPYKQGANINGSSSRGENCETCAAYNMLKLTRDLYIYDPDNAEYMDYYERTVLNQIAASQSHDSTSSMHNGCTYMLPIDPGQRRDYDSDYGGFTCCNGTGMENHVIYQIAAYAKTADTLYVNLFMPSTADWAEKGVSVKQETKFPSEDSKLTVTGNGEFTMKIRVPYWATAGFTVKVNGEVICTEPEPSSYVAITRAWADGDVVDIHMPYTLHLDKTPDAVGGSVVASLMYGPMVMVAKDNRSSYSAMNWYVLSLNDNNLTGAVSVKEAAGTGKVPHLVVEGLDFYPMYDAYNYRYHAYVKLMAAESLLNPEYLQSAVDKVTGANAPDPNDFEAAEWTAFQAALNNAQELLAKESGVTQLQLFDAQVALEAAVEGKSEAEFVPVADITEVPDRFTAGDSLTLTGTPVPANATYKVITWSLKDANTTGAELSGNVLTAENAGTITVTATVAKGLDGKDYTKDFIITVEAKDVPVDPPVPVEGLVLHYDFESLTEGNVVTDISGHGMDGIVVPGGNATVQAEIGGRTQTAIVIAGGQPEEGNGYVEMPAGVLNDLDSLTVSCWVSIDKTVDYGRIWDFGSNTTSYMYLLDAGGNEGHEGYTAAITASGWSNEVGPVKGTNLDTGVWKFTTVTFDGKTNTLSLYEDGKLIEAAVTAADLSVLNGSTRNRIGYGQFEDDMLNGKIADFRIYDHALNADEVAALLKASDEPSFVAVESISGVPTDAIEGKALTLTGTVTPQNANNQAIVWAMKDAGSTDAVLSGNVLTAAKPGTVVVTATVVNGAAEGKDFVQEFAITVAENEGAKAAEAAKAAAEKAAAAAEKAETARIAAENASVEAAGYTAEDMTAAQTAAAKAAEAADKAGEAKAEAAKAQTEAEAAAKAASAYDVAAAKSAEVKAEAAQTAAEAAQAAAEAAAEAADKAAKAQKAQRDAEAAAETAAKAAAVKAAEAASTEAAKAAIAAQAAAETAASYDAKDQRAAIAAADAAAEAVKAAEAAQKAAQAARDAMDSISAKDAQAAAEAALADAKTAEAEAKAAAQDQKLQAEAEAAAVRAMEEAIAAAEASAAAARASAEEAKAASAEALGYTAVDMTAAMDAELAAVRAETAVIEAEGAAAAAARAADAVSAAAEAQKAQAGADAAAASAEAAKAAAARQAAQAAAEAAEQLKAAITKAVKAAQEAAAAASEARKAADAASIAASADMTAADAAQAAAVQAEAAAQKAAEAALKAREAAEAADYDAAVQAASASAAAAEAAAASAASAMAQAEAQAARKLAEDSAAAAEKAEKKAAEAAAKSEASGDEAEEASEAAKAAREAAEAAQKAADAAADAADHDDIEAAKAAKVACASSAKVAAALKEVVEAKAEIIAAKAQIKEAATRTEAERKAAEEAMAAAEAANAEATRAALGAAKQMAIAKVRLAAVLEPDADPTVFEKAFAAIEAAEDVAAVDAAITELEKTLEETPSECPSRNFTDVPGVDNWAHEGIDFCIANGYMNGTAANIFSPAGVVTRAQLVTILYRIAGEPETEFKGVFTDVADGKWYSEAIEWAAANDVVNGVGENKFNPMGAITREQIAAILYRCSKAVKVEGDLKAFPDAADASTYAIDALVWAVDEGLITGIKSGDVTILAPKDNATRAQIASIIMRYLES